MPILASFTTKSVQTLAASRLWTITVPAGRPIYVSIDPQPAGAVRKDASSALLQPGQTYTFGSDPVDLFLSVVATDPLADATPVSLAYVDAGAAMAVAVQAQEIKE